MSDTYEDIARRASQRLRTEFGESLPAAVDAKLQGPDSAPQRYEPATIIALATLILNIAKFAWDVYRDRKKEAKTVDSNSIERTVRLQFEVKSNFTEAQRDKVISTVVDELLRAPPQS